MSRPLVITDCDEVLLHMIVPFKEWLAQDHAIDFNLERQDFFEALTRRDNGALVQQAEIWSLLSQFFDTEMNRQSPISGAVAGLEALAEHADIVVLTNLEHHRQEARSRQLADHGLTLRVFTNQGPKGPALQAILDEYKPSQAVFIDDLAQHHGSVAQMAPQVARLHLCGEPQIAAHITCAHKAGHADARIDDWHTALPWLLNKIHGETND